MLEWVNQAPLFVQVAAGVFLGVVALGVFALLLIIIAFIYSIVKDIRKGD